MTTNWATAMTDYFGVKLAEDTADRWFSALRQQCRDLNDEELEAVITCASFKDRSKFAGKPTLKDVRMWVFWRRREMRAGDGPEWTPEACAMCTGGWILYEYDKGMMDTPCTCTGGQALMEKLYKPEERNYLNAQARKAREQEAERQANIKVWTQAWIDGGKPGVGEILDSIGKGAKCDTARADLRHKANADRIEAMGEAWEPGD